MLPTRSGLADTLTSALRASTPPAPLIDVNAQHDRFKPATLRDGLISVYTIWNVLDRLNYQTIHNWTLPWLYGYIRPVQLEALVAAVRAPGVRTYCEVGFNGGHSAAAVLYATSNVTVRSFDTGYYGKHTQQNSAFLRSVQPERFTFVDGDSSKTLPQLGQRVRAGMEPPCDVVFIDGSHKLAAVAADIRNFREAVTCGGACLPNRPVPKGMSSDARPRASVALFRSASAHGRPRRRAGPRTEAGGAGRALPSAILGHVRLEQQSDRPKTRRQQRHALCARRQAHLQPVRSHLLAHARHRSGVPPRLAPEKVQDVQPKLPVGNGLVHLVRPRVSRRARASRTGSRGRLRSVVAGTVNSLHSDSHSRDQL